MTAADLARYYDESLPVVLYLKPSTGATAGTPGTWTPANTRPPASVADLIAGKPNAVVASPLAAWTTGQFVQTRTPGAAGQANWTGTAWASGVHALEATQQSSSLPADPGGFTVSQVQAWVGENPELADEVVEAEQARPNPRSTLVSWLETFITDRDAEDAEP